METKPIDKRRPKKWHYRAICNKCKSEDCQIIKVIDEYQNGEINK